MITSLHWLLTSLLLVIINEASAEYYINPTNIPSYLHHKYESIDDEIFPKDIRIKVSVSRMAGILLYSIDQNLNQLIVSLHDEIPNVLQVELNTDVMKIKLNQLCGCQVCLYRTLDLRITIANQIQIQCNGGKIKKFENNYKTDLNKDYPILFSSPSPQKRLPNKAHLWLVNVDRYKAFKFNPKQMYGCIFRVMYKDQPITFTRVSSSIEDHCKETCTDFACNGGKCSEVYNDGPLCNCSGMKLGGRYCNKDLTLPQETTKTHKTKSNYPHHSLEISLAIIIIATTIFIIRLYIRKRDTTVIHRTTSRQTRIISGQPSSEDGEDDDDDKYRMDSVLNDTTNICGVHDQPRTSATSKDLKRMHELNRDQFPIFDIRLPSGIAAAVLGIPEIPVDELSIGQDLGKGSFADVHIARLTGHGYVAVKILRLQDEREAYINEAQIMFKLRHKRVVELIGICSLPGDGSFYIVMELMSNGTLLYQLLEKKPSRSTQVKIMLQIAKGMEYLESKKCIHRDLRTANILVSNTMNVKISDFGLAKIIKEDYIIDPKVTFPLFWMSPEAWFEHKFSVKSDVWSFGILMLEIVCHGQPQFLNADQNDYLSRLRSGYRFSIYFEGSQICCNTLYDIMMSCWAEDPEQRPSFKNLRKTFKKI